MQLGRKVSKSTKSAQTSSIALGLLLTQSLAASAQSVPGAPQTLAPFHGVQASRLPASHNVLKTDGMTSSQIGQVLNSGARSFQLSGTLPISGNLNIPRGVTVVDFVTAANANLNVLGNLTASGRLLFRTTDPLVGAANLVAANVKVNPGGMIASLDNLNLNISASSNIVNAGAIRSAGNLTMSAANSISNLAGSAGITASANVNLFSPTINNAALISSGTGNININASLPEQSILLNNINGTLRAAENINFRSNDYVGNGSVVVTGGNFDSKQLNFFSGKGNVDVAVDDVTGVVNVTACNAHVGAATPNLVLGEINVSHDPTYFNTAGNVTLSGPPITTSGADLAILASGDVTINAPIDTSGGDLLVVAGAKLSSSLVSSGNSGSDPDSVTLVTIANGSGTNKGSSSGGNLTMTLGAFTSPAVPALPGGDVTLIAYAGDDDSKGTVNFGSLSIAGTAGEANGNVRVIAGAKADVNGNSGLFSGLINSSSNSGAPGGTVYLYSATPTIQGSNISVIDGTVQPGSGSFMPLSFRPGLVRVGTINVSGPVQVATAGNIKLDGSVTTEASSALLAGGNISSNAPVTIGSGTDGASVLLAAGVSMTPGSTISKINISGASSTGGNIDLSSNSSTIFTTGGAVTVWAFAASDYSNGTISLGPVNSFASSSAKKSGDVTVYAGGNGNAIIAGDINTRSLGKTGSGVVRLATGDLASAGLVVDNGTFTGVVIPISKTNSGSISTGKIEGAGDIFIEASGDITLNNSLFNTPTSALGPSGRIFVSANGILTFADGSSITSNGNGNTSGGIIQLTASNIQVTSSSNVLVWAGGSTSDAGTILINSDSANYQIGSGNGQLSLSASAGGTFGSAGKISVTSKSDLTIDTSGISADASSKGHGASLIFDAPNISITGDLNVSTDFGTAGSISITTNSTTSFDIGATGLNSINGNLIATSKNGNGGSVTVVNNGTGGINLLSPSNIQVAGGPAMPSGNITLSAANAPLQIGPGSLTLVGDAFGELNLTGKSIVLDQTGTAISAPNGLVRLKDLGEELFVNSNATISARNVEFISVFGSINIQGTVTPGDSIALMSASPITQKTVSAVDSVASFPQHLILISTGSSIGSALSPLNVYAPFISANADKGSVYLVNSWDKGSITLRNSSVDGVGYDHNSAAADFHFVADKLAGADKLIVSAALSASDVLLQSSTQLGTSNNLVTVSGSNSIALISVGDLLVSDFPTVVSTANLVISTSGDIGTQAARFTFDASAITASAKSAYLIDTHAGGDITLADASVGGQGYTNKASGDFFLAAPNQNLLNRKTDTPVIAQTIVLSSSGGISLAAGAGDNTTKQIGIFASDTFVTSGGKIQADEIDISINGGNIGADSGHPVVLTSGKLALQASSGSVWAKSDISTNSVTLVDAVLDGNVVSSGAGATYQVRSDVPMTLSTTVKAAAIDLNSGVSKLTVTGSSLAAKDITLTADVISVTDNAISSKQDALNNAGVVTLTAANGFELGNAASYLSVAANGANNAGAIVINSAKDLTVGPSAGSLLLSATGDTGLGSVTIDVRSGTNSVLSVDPSGINVTGTGPNAGGGTIALYSSKAVDFSSGTGLQVDAIGNGNGGSIDIKTGTMTWVGKNSSQPFTLSASAQSAAAAGNGGKIFITLTDGNSNTRIANDGLILNASAAQNGNGGEVNINVAGDLDFAGAKVTGGSSSGDGGTMKVVSAKALNLTKTSYSVSSTAFSLSLPVSGAGGSMLLQGATINFAGLTTLTADSAVGNAIGSGGSIEIKSGQSADFKFDQISSISARSFSLLTGDGGTIKISTGGKLVVEPSALSYGASSIGAGGKLYLSGSQVLGSSATLKLSAPGGGGGSSDTGAGGLISIVQTTTLAQSIGPTGNFDLSATAGKGGGDGGTIIVTTGGALTVIPSSANVSPVSSGKGGSLTLAAGGNLQIKGALNLDGIDGGNGGYLELNSNSKTPFTVNSKTAVNGVQGTISVSAGKSGVTEGTVVLNNAGGNVVMSQVLPNVSSFTAKTKTGSVTVSANLGAFGKTNIINLIGATGVNASGILQSAAISGSSSAGTVTLSKVDVGTQANVTASAKGNITLTGYVGKSVTPQLFDLAGVNSSAGTITVNTPGAINVSLAVTASKDITIKSTSTSASNALTINASVQSAAGAVTVANSGTVDSTAPGLLNAKTNLKVTAGNTMTLLGRLSSGALLMLTSSKDLTLVANAQSTSGALSVTSSKGDVLVFQSDLSSGNSVSVTASLGKVSLGSVGVNIQPKSFTVLAANGIDNNGGAKGEGITVLPTGTLTETVTGANQKIQISSNLNGGTVNLTASNTGASVSATGNADLSATKAINVTVAKGDVSLVTIGASKAPDTVKVSALNSVQVSGAMNGNKSIALSTTSKTVGNGNLSVFGSSNDPITTLSGNNITVSRTGAIGDNVTPLKVNAGTSLTLNSTNAFVNVQNTGTTVVKLNASSSASVDTFSLISAGPVQTNGTIGGSNITMTAKGITVADKTQIGTASTAGVTLNSNGADSKTLGSGFVQATGTISLRSTTSHSFGSGTDKSTGFAINSSVLKTSTKGLVNALNSSSAGTSIFVLGTSMKSLAVSSTNSITTNGAMDNVSSLFLLSDNGNITLQQGAGKAGVTNLVKLTAANIGAAVDFQGNTVISKSLDVYSFAGFGSIVGGAISVNTTNLTLASQGEVNVSNKSVSPLNLNNSSSLSAFTLSTPGSLTLHDVIVASSGDMNISSKGTLSTAPGANLTVFGGGLKLLNLDTAKGNIVIGAGSQITTNGIGGGSVQILIGGSSGVQGTAPAGVNYNPPGDPNFLFGSNGIKVVNPTRVDMTIVGAVSVEFNTGARPSSAITVNGGTPTGAHTLIMADPPVSVSPTAPPVSSALGSAPPSEQGNSDTLEASSQGSRSIVASGGGLIIGGGMSGNSLSIGANTLTYSGAGGTISASPFRHLLATPPLAISPTLTASPGISTLKSGIYSQSAASIASSNQPQYVTETELVNGEIPAELITQLEFGIKPESKQQGLRPVALTEYGAISLANHVSKSVFVVADSDKTINTPYGVIHISAGSMVLVLNFSNGVAVYDLDDTHRAAVKVSTRNHEFHLFPGSSVLLSSEKSAEFEHLNPAQLFAYRGITKLELDSELSAFSSEFYVPLALKVVQPLKQLVNSKHPNAKKFSHHLLKTTVAGLQTRGRSEQFKQIPKSKNLTCLSSL